MVKEDYLASNCSSNDFILASYYCMMKVLSLEIVIFLVTVFWIVLALYPKRKELRVYSNCENAGVTQRIISVLEFPPSELESSLVSEELR